jgi:hypothetical protein
MSSTTDGDDQNNPYTTVYDHQGERIMSFSPSPEKPLTCRMQLHFSESNISFHIKNEYIDSMIEALRTYRNYYRSGY